VRLDIGFRIPGADYIGFNRPPIDTPPPDDFLGLPIAIAIGLGEAY
jgi:hypothetical protein